MAAPVITQLPTPPDMLDEPVDFVERADNLLGALPQLVTEVNASTAFVDAQAIAAESAKNSAAGSASTATTKASEASSSASTAADHSTQTGLDRIATGEDRLQTGEDRIAVLNALDSIADGPVTSVNGQTGVVTLVADDVGAALADMSNVAQQGVRGAAGIGTNAEGNRSVSTGWPSGGVDGDIHYQVGS